MGTLGLLGSGTAGLIYSLNEAVKAEGLELHASNHPWYHHGVFNSYDHASVRRGYEVYKQVCSACHSIKYVAYRNLVGTIMTEDEAKREAEEAQIQDGPDEVGNMFMRPGKLSDYVPSPYPNEEAARAANNGAYPVDLTYITNGRHGGEDYIFALLTGYCDAPAGVTMQEGQYYHPYFPGGAISMAQALYNEVIEYSDGTPATQSQLAKDVVTFLKWTAEPEMEERKRMAIKAIPLFAFLFFVALYFKRLKWTVIKNRKIEYVPTTKKWKHK